MFDQKKVIYAFLNTYEGRSDFLLKHKIYSFFLFRWPISTCLDPDPRTQSGSGPDPKHCSKHFKNFCRQLAEKSSRELATGKVSLLPFSDGLRPRLGQPAAPPQPCCARSE